MQTATIDERFAQLLEEAARGHGAPEKVYENALNSLLYEGMAQIYGKDAAQGMPILRWMLEHRSLIPEPVRPEMVAQALAAMARGYERRGDLERALACFRQVFDLAPDPAAVPDGGVVDALNDCLDFLNDQKRYDALIDAVDRIDAWPRDRADDDLESGLCYLLSRKGVALIELGRAAEAYAGWEALAARYARMPLSRDELVESLYSHAEVLYEHEKLARAMEILRFCLPRFPLAPDDAQSPRIAKVLEHIGWDLGYPFEGPPAPEAVEAFELLYRHYREAAAVELRHMAIDARCRQVAVLTSLERYADALACGQDLHAIPLSGLPDPLLKQLADTAFKQAELFWELGEDRAALGALVALDTRWRGIEMPEVRAIVAGGLFRQVTVHLAAKAWQKAGALIRVAVERYGREVDDKQMNHAFSIGIAGQPRISADPLVLMATVELQSMLSRLSRGDARSASGVTQALYPAVDAQARKSVQGVLEAVEKLLRAFEALPPADLAPAVAWLQIGVGIGRFRLGDEDGALERFRAVIRLHGKSDDLLIQRFIADASVLIALVQIVSMKRRWVLEGARAGRDACVALRRKLEADPDVWPELPLNWLLMGYLEFLAGELEPAVESVSGALAASKEARAVAGGLGKFYTLPRDAAFQALVTPGA